MHGWEAIKESIDEFKTELKEDFKSLKKDNEEMRRSHTEMSADIKLIKRDVGESKEKVAEQHKRLITLEDSAKFKERLANLMKFILPTLIGIAGLVFTYIRFFYE